MLTIAPDVADQITLDLLKNGGVATLTLPTELSKIHKKAFEDATAALDLAKENREGAAGISIPIIGPNSNSASVTGYHSAGGDNALSRYNCYREGFIFSNGECFDVPLMNGINSNLVDDEYCFEKSMNEMFNSLYGVIAKSTLEGIARYLKIEEDWFHETMGPMDKSSQWHLKRYVEPDNPKALEEECESGKEEIEWLPVHTDPSLISVIIHDVPGINENAMGLQYQSPQTKGDTGEKKREWKEVNSHGHAVATIFCGSVMSYITGGLFQSAKHRVVYRPINDKRQRQAATLFLRPRGKSILTVPPSDILSERGVRVRRNCKFDDWLNRVSRNYQTKKGGKQKGAKKEESKAKINIDPVFWADEYTELTLHGCSPELTGKEKYLGGELCKLNNHIYTIPGFAGRVLDMDVSVEPPNLQLIGPELPGEFKWLRGIPIGDTIYGIPCHSDSVLKINALTNKIELLKWDGNQPGSCPPNQKWKYHGAAESDIDGCIYCIPQAAERVMKIDPKTDEISFIGPVFPGVNKWYGGLLLNDSRIYGICQNATGILSIDPKTQDCRIFGNFPEGEYKWHGAVHHPDGNLYCIPAHANKVLKVEPGLEPKLSLLGSNIHIRTGEHRKDGKYKFLGGAVSCDCVYFFPSDADYVCEVNTTTGKVREVGPNLRDLEPMRNNKWQNGFTTSDGTVYGIPLKGETVLRIRPNAENGEPDVTTIGGPYTGLNKWEGGVSTPNGDMYCMPLNHKYSLRIRPLFKKKQQKHQMDEDESHFQYNIGQATLRSSMHTVRYAKGRADDPGPNVNRVLPPEIRSKHIISYDMNAYNLRDEVARMLGSLDPNMIGKFRHQSKVGELEDFVVPNNSLVPVRKTRRKTGGGEKAQRMLTDFIANDTKFLELFDRFVCEFIIPLLKERLEGCDALDGDGKPVTFFYQRPPTLRIQPGPSTKKVTAHSDATYGHQDGELNFWMPLSDPEMTKTDLWSESIPGKEDFKPLGAKLGEIVAFHGSSCKHFVPRNETKFTRVSLDFRIGCEQYFDPTWKMPGTIADHTRRCFIL